MTRSAGERHTHGEGDARRRVRSLLGGGRRGRGRGVEDGDGRSGAEGVGRKTDRTTTARTPDLVEAALLEVASVPGGIHRSVLWAAVAARLAEMNPSAPPPDAPRL